jgi:hypothetical protein
MMKTQGALILLAVSGLLAGFPQAVSGYECASVSIYIRQELTMDRQAFEAKMTIDNGFDGLNLTNLTGEGVP